MRKAKNLMNYELSVDKLVRNTKEDLIELLKVELDRFDEAEEIYGEGEGMNHIGNIESICYTLRNCDYKGSEN